jgi:hypothetical protein
MHMFVKITLQIAKFKHIFWKKVLMDLDVKGILTDIAEAGAVTNQHLYNLLAYFCEHPK